MADQPMTDFPGATDLALGPLAPRVEARLAAAGTERIASRVWERDAALWKTDPEHVAVIRNRLGWLDVADRMRGEIPRLTGLARALRGEGYTRALLLGMGGSSLAPEVFRETFGAAGGFLDLQVLDSTAPRAVLAAAAGHPPRETLYLVSSKSGGTLETLSFFRWFFARAEAELGRGAAGAHFVAITDPGSGLGRLARESGFREVFENPADIGGRYSALSFFGLVPAALGGVDLATLLDRARRMAAACRDPDPASNPGLRLGVALAEAARSGRDKATIRAPAALASFGAWAEQLLAESTGKEGKGIVPIDAEPPGPPGAYGDDRFFVTLALDGAPIEPPPGPGAALHLRDILDLGAEFFRWEFATAVAGALLAIDPFDEPNVKESKDNTARILAGPPREAPSATLVQDGVAAFSSKLHEHDLAALLSAFFGEAPEHGYVAIQAYLAPAPGTWRALQALRGRIRDRLSLATTLGWGPRFLHSTGQLHKGGPQVGTFLQLVEDPGPEVVIPAASPHGLRGPHSNAAETTARLLQREEASSPRPPQPTSSPSEPSPELPAARAFPEVGKESFGRILAAQADGDLAALEKRGPRVLRCHLGPDTEAALAELSRAFEKGVRAP